MKKTFLCGFLATALLLLSCVPAQDRPEEFQSEVARINAAHLKDVVWTPAQDIKKYEYALPENEVGFTEQELNELTDYSRAAEPAKTASVTARQASSDAEQLFRVLKYCYAPYLYFGGDASFGKAESAVLSEIKAKGPSVSTADFQDLLLRSLSFLQDCHFSIGGGGTADTAEYYDNETIEFEKDKLGFYKVQDGKRAYVQTVGGKDPAAIMKRSVNPDGKLVYYAGGIYWGKKTEGYPLLNVHYRDGFADDALLLAPSAFAPHTGGFEESSFDGIPIVSLRRCWDKDAGDTTGEDFAKTGSSLRNRKVFILDIRGNGGGSDEYFIQWLKNYTGNSNLQSLSTNEAVLGLKSRAGAFLFSKTIMNFPKPGEQARREVDEAMKYYRSEKNTWEVGSTPRAQIENRNLIFVLMDNGVASSGESIVAQLRNVKNVVFAGTNTRGCMLGNAEVQFVLPDSKMRVTCGNWVTLRNPDIFSEGEGFRPDLWIEKNSLGRLLQMIRYYKIRGCE